MKCMSNETITASITDSYDNNAHKDFFNFLIKYMSSYWKYMTSF